MYQLVNAMTCEIIDPASPNAECWLFMGQSQMSLYLCHLDLLSRSLRSTVYQLVNAITCEIIDPASPNSVCWLFMGRSRTGLYLGHLDLLSR